MNSDSYCARSHLNEWDRNYHDLEYGFPICSDVLLFERLVMEINQAGLSWLTVLKKKAAFNEAFKGYDIYSVARFNDSDIERLMHNAAIIRNKLKIKAIIHNAQIIETLQMEFGSFKGWLDFHHPMSLENWVRLFKKTFRFTGPEIVREFLLSTGYLQGAHEPECPIYCQIMKLTPPWMLGNQ